MKKQLLLLSIMLVASGLYSSSLSSKPLPLVRGLKAFAWPLKPFTIVNDETKAKVKQEIEKNWSEICKGHTQEEWDTLLENTGDPKKDNKKQRKANYKRAVLQDLSCVGNGGRSIEDKDVLIYWYGPKCPTSKKFIKFCHYKPYTYIASGIWYVILAAGTARGVQKVIKYFKKRNKTKRKEQGTAGSIVA